MELPPERRPVYLAVPQDYASRPEAERLAIAARLAELMRAAGMSTH